MHGREVHADGVGTLITFSSIQVAISLNKAKQWEQVPVFPDGHGQYA